MTGGNDGIIVEGVFVGCLGDVEGLGEGRREGVTVGVRDGSFVGAAVGASEGHTKEGD